ncbi:hypothetical protein GC089_17815 [Cellulomonas sp. JZ18]|uniref:hypothetical protein n=1 Tax=Cellulomonas sp. JZ18 TaxID=2654191 RepID=UPI0012D3938E|nr:hypothetical protein [Cellulomonas sp. JZ18]QGQ20701.1 hypothetical protein GC089_17815 [Cellulomonas sp. JZ18]
MGSTLHGVPTILLVVGIALLVLLVGVGVLLHDGRRASAPTGAARAAVRHATLTAAVALLPLGGLLALALAQLLASVRLPVGHVLVAVPSACLALFLLLHAVGETTWPRPSGELREASLVHRTVADVAPASLRALAAAWAGLLVASCTAFALLADGPRTVARLTGGTEAFVAAPFPGWLWGVPAVVSGLVAGALAVLVLRLVAARPAVPGVTAEWDMWLRRRAARRVLRATQLVLGLTVAGVLQVAGSALERLGRGEGWGGWTAALSTPHVVAGRAVTVTALLVLVTSALAALWPARDRAPDALPRPAALGPAPDGAPA